VYQGNFLIGFVNFKKLLIANATLILLFLVV